MVTTVTDYSWPLPSDLCPVWISLDVLLSTASIMHLCAISLHRYVGIRHPIQQSQNQTSTRTRVQILAVWTISAAVSFPVPVLGLRDHSKVFRDGVCVLTDGSFVLIGSLVAFFLPLTIMVVTYFLSVRTLQSEASLCLQQLVPRPKWSTTFTLSFLPPPGAQQAGGGAQRAGGGVMSGRGSVSSALFGRHSIQSLSNEQKASQVLGVVFLLFVVMWCPFFVTNVLAVACGPAACDAVLLGQLLNVFVWVGYLSSAVNPLVYTLFNHTYRTAFLRFLRCRYRPDRKRLQLILVNTIPPIALSSTHLHLPHATSTHRGWLRGGAPLGQETDTRKTLGSHESCV